MRKTTHSIYFFDRSKSEFEELVFKYVLKLRKWNTLQWLGAPSIDKERDILGVDENQETYCYQCINYARLTFLKAVDVIDKLPGSSLPNHLIIVCGGALSASLKNKIERYAQGLGIKTVEAWSGAELESKLQERVPGLFEKFIKRKKTNRKIGDRIPPTYTEK